MSGVMALLAEALHTLSDIFISGFLLIAARYPRRRADEVCMFGYGRAQNVAALVAATVFFSFTSFELCREAIPRLLQSTVFDYQNLSLVVVVLVASMLIAAIPLIKLLLQKERGAAIKAQLLELGRRGPGAAQCCRTRLRFLDRALGLLDDCAAGLTTVNTAFAEIASLFM
jgi:divalent metal cation (Fe/Co/Zn/Cd) transporter